jgi:hypothetical protein
VDYVGSDFGAPVARQPAQPVPSGFGDDQSNIFQHQFGGFFGPDFFNPFGNNNNFNGFNFGSFNNFKPWYKG